MHKLLAAGALLASLTGAAFAADTAEMAQVGEVMIQDAWARASIGNAPNSAAYMTLETTGAEPDRLVASSTPVAAKAELHSHSMEGGVAKMRPVDAVEVAPGTPTVLEPGGLHIMLVGLKQKLAPGDTIPLTLVFEHAGEVTIELPVRGMAGMGGHSGHGAMGEGEPKTN
jgi:periplasmic copper chaperone A